jgi:3-hydroxyisobutyrate dehydrogenase-like beta-hydroxyacid dehydrogenase
MISPSATVCIVGFGEAGQRIGVALARRGFAVRGYDLLLENTLGRTDMQRRIEAAGVAVAWSLAEAMRGAKLVISAVAKGDAPTLAGRVSDQLQSGQVFHDIRSPALQALLESLGCAANAAEIAYDSPLAFAPPQRGELP